VHGKAHLWYILPYVRLKTDKTRALLSRVEGESTVSSDVSDAAEFAARIERLERTVHELRQELRLGERGHLPWWKRWRQNDVLEAEQFVVRDAKGVRRAYLGATADGWACLRMYDEAGNRCASVAVSREGCAHVRLYDGADEPRAALSVFPEGLGEGLVLRDKAGKPRVTVSVVEDGTGDLSIRDDGGRVTWKAP
jgi:hypothetical protein